MEAIRRTKLVCTLGPASAQLVGELIATGMDVARVNLAHGTDTEHTSAVKATRAASRAADRAVAVMVDLVGPKIRLGELVGGMVELEAGDSFVLRPTSRDAGGPDGASVTYERLAADLEVGDRVLLADGAAELRVTARDTVVETEVVRGGFVRSRAGVAVPAGRLSGPALTARDLADLGRVRRLRPDLVAQSFVRGPSDITELRQLLGPAGPGIVAKIETRPAVDAFDQILDVVDAVMVARGDLGVELPFEEVPLVQKQLVRRALDRGVPSIVATQMLESMTSAPRPTRAEVSDVANAVLDGADAIMLSAETAIGAFPVLAAEAAIRVATLCEERGSELLPRRGAPLPEGPVGPLAIAAVALAEADDEIAAIACYTRTGRTARILSMLRPRTPIFAFASDPSVVRRLALADGVVPRDCPRLRPGQDPNGFVLRELHRQGLVPTGSPVLVVSAVGPTSRDPNTLAVRLVGGP